MQKQNFNMNAVHMVPMDEIAGFEVRPGLYELNGAVAIPVGVNFTIHSLGATSCELLLFRRMEDEPYAILKFPDHYRVGNVYSMIVFGLPGTYCFYRANRKKKKKRSKHSQEKQKEQKPSASFDDAM